MTGMLRQNSELRPHRIWNFSIPAWFITRADGSRFYTCPNAGPCARVCYARNGTYLFPAVLAAHTRNLDAYLNDRGQWLKDLNAELATAKFRPNGLPRGLPHTDSQFLNLWARAGGAAVRIHDSGDFFSEQYLHDWLAVAEQTPDVLFYAYTKEVEMFRANAGRFPSNFKYLFSTGGLQDHLLNDTDRHADVFPDEQGITDAGYESQSDSDLLAVFLPTNRIGIPANRIPHFIKRMAGNRFSELAPGRRKPTAEQDDNA
jgi:hypothetical protein